MKLILTATILFAIHAGASMPVRTEARTPVTFDQLFQIVNRNPNCGGTYSVCVVNSDCCSGRCAGYGQRACIPASW